MNYYIYTLSCPITNKVKYVGQTNNPKNRLSGHITDAGYGESNKKKWIRELLNGGHKPIMNIVCMCNLEHVDELEYFFYKHYSASNILFNDPNRLIGRYD